MIAPVPVIAAGPTAAVPAIPAAAASPAASFGDVLMRQVAGAPAATAALGRAVFPSTNIAAAASPSAGGNNTSAASQLTASASGRKKSGAAGGQAPAVANVLGMQVVAAPPLSAGKAGNTTAAQTGTVHGDVNSGDDRPAEPVAASLASSASPILSATPVKIPPAQFLVSAPVSTAHPAPAPALSAPAVPAVNDGPASKGTGKGNREARPGEVVGQSAPAPGSAGLRRGDAPAALAATAAQSRPVSIIAEPSPAELPRFSQTAQESPRAHNAAPLLSTPASGGDIEGLSAYGSWPPSTAISPPSVMTAAGQLETEDRVTTVEGLAPFPLAIRSSAPAYAEPSAGGAAVTRAGAAVPHAATAATAATLRPTAFLAGPFPAPAGAETAVTSPGTPPTTSPDQSVTPSDLSISNGHTSHPAIAGSDTSREASGAPAFAMPPALSSLLTHTGITAQTSTAQTSTAGVRVRGVPPLRGSDEDFHSTQDSAPHRPGLSALPPLRGSALMFPTPPPQTEPGSHTDSTGAVPGPNRSAVSDPAETETTAEMSPAILGRTVSWPTARAANPAPAESAAEVFPATLSRTVSSPMFRAANPAGEGTALPSALFPRQQVSSPNPGTSPQTSVAAAVQQRSVPPVPSVPQNSSDPAPAKAVMAPSPAAFGPATAATSRAANAAKPAGTPSEFRAPASSQAVASPPVDANAAPDTAAAPSEAPAQAAPAADAADSAPAALADPLPADAAPLNPVAPGNAKASENVKAGPESAAPARVSRRTGDSQAKPSSPPAASDSANESQHPSSSLTLESAATSPDKAQAPAAASPHPDQPAAVVAAQPAPLGESRQAPAHRDAASNDTPAPAAAANLPRPADSAAPAPVAVQSARVLERMGQTEMRVGVNTADFGNLELRASVSQDRVGASIATAHADLRAAMMAEMTSLEHSMEQHQLRLDHLDLGAHGGSQQRGGSAQQQQARSQSGGDAGLGTTSSLSGEAAASADRGVPSLGNAPHSSGLNVHA